MRPFFLSQDIDHDWQGLTVIIEYGANKDGREDWHHHQSLHTKKPTLEPEQEKQVHGQAEGHETASAGWKVT